jgi:chemotaxis protein CheX
LIKPFVGAAKSQSMAETPQITEALIHDSIVRSVASVFKTMLRHEIKLADETVVAEPPSPSAKSQIVGAVGFAGMANGLIYLCFSDDFAKIATARILGMALAEVEMHGVEVVNDAIGEITNMTVGGFKNALCDIGFPCKLSLPTIVRASNLSVASVKSAHRHIFHFECVGHRIIADIQMKAD